MFCQVFIERVISIVIAILKQFIWIFFEITFIRIYITMILNDIVVVFIDVKRVKYFGTIVQSNCNIRRFW